MSVYIANFGVQNYEWPECLKRGTIATVNEVKAFELWKIRRLSWPTSENRLTPELSVRR